MADLANLGTLVPTILAHMSTSERLRVDELARAYLSFAESDHGTVLLRHWIETKLGRVQTTPEEEGERRLVLEVLQGIATAPQTLARLQAQYRME